MTNVSLEAFTHNSQHCIAIKFPYNFELKEYIKQFHGVRWTKTHSTFYIYYNEVRIENLKIYLAKGDIQIITNNKNEVAQRISTRGIKIEQKTLNKEKTIVYKHYLDYLKGKRFSKSTIASYSNFILEFLRFTEQKPVDNLNENDVRNYIEWAVTSLNYAVSTHRQMVSGFKHFAHFYPACSINIDKIYMPKKDRKLPIVLSIEEVISLLQATKNLKHRVILAMLYSSGLRISEIIDLQLSDFDFKRKQLHIQNSKGRKDRYATIAESVFPLIKNYYKTYKPKKYFIENPKGGKYSAESIRSFLKQSLRLAKITKNATPHTLRHSYATHMLEQGIGIRHIQELLGHSRPETTMIYTHVTRKDLEQIKSPLDTAINNLSLQGYNNKEISIS
ncbi:tyrosine-type recombinase/integrase [Polaribacter haliotis]|uniref:Tyrosine-type recombinase/integrase n=1 Tax=Polaribacter haliotis TaxID=1888915 RepID=A0A7L8ABP6_9FLAO|nr:tyrosine-type recombinase/integrase [Polaribacter haliotis]QOD59420.1 tyrosine-type recombinase/integrase [Polaribacter haliotis]